MLVAVLLIIFAFLAYYKPFFAVGTILALLPTYLIRFSFHNLPTTFLELLVLIFLILTFAKNFRQIPSLKKLGSINWFILAFIIAGVISTIISPDLHSAVGILKAFIVEPVLFFYALKLIIHKPEDLTTPLNLLFLGAIVLSLFGILQYFTFIKLPLQFWGTGAEVERITSAFDYPNALALYLAPLISFFLGAFMFDDKILNRKNLVAGLVVMIAAIVLTFSRGAWLALLFTAFILLFVKYPIKKVLPVILVLIAIVFAIPQTRNRLLLVANDASSSAHLDLMSQALTKIEHSPILGNGLFGFRTTLGQQGFSGEILNYPHNIFFNFWLDMGLLGLLSFFGIIFISANNYKKNHSWYVIAAIAYLLTMIIHGIVDVPYFKNDLSILFWFVIAMFYI